MRKPHKPSVQTVEVGMNHVFRNRVSLSVAGAAKVLANPFKRDEHRTNLVDFVRQEHTTTEWANAKARAERDGVEAHGHHIFRSRRNDGYRAVCTCGWEFDRHGADFNEAHEELGAHLADIPKKYQYQDS